MKDIPLNLLIQAGKLNAEYPWLWLLKVTIGTEVIRLVQNVDNITYQGEEYFAFPFQLGNIEESSKGELLSFTLQIGNPYGIMQSYAEQYDGAVGASLQLIRINAGYLGENYTGLTFSFEVLGCSTDSEWVNFTVGFPNPMRKRFPPKRYIPGRCIWNYRSAECGFQGDIAVYPTCARILVDCRLHINPATQYHPTLNPIDPGMIGGGVPWSNSVRFVGYLGLKPGSLRIV